MSEHSHVSNSIASLIQDQLLETTVMEFDPNLFNEETVTHASSVAEVKQFLNLKTLCFHIICTGLYWLYS